MQNSNTLYSCQILQPHGREGKDTSNTSMGTTLGCCLKISVQDPNYFTCYPQNGWGVKETLCLTWPLTVLSLVTKELLELFSEPTHRLCYYSYSYSTILPSASYCDKLQTEYMEALTFVQGIIGFSEQKEWWMYE